MLVLGALIYVGFAVTRSADRVEVRQEAAATTQTLGEVADPLAQLCRTDTSVRQRVGRACDTAEQAVITVAERGTDGRNGDDGTNGVNGTDGTNGVNGTNGANGITPACYFTPSQCQGRDGTNGTNGTNGKDGVNGTNGTDGQSPPCLSEPGQCRGPGGPPGPVCPDGSTASPYTFPDGVAGFRCVTAEQGAPDGETSMS